MVEIILNGKSSSRERAARWMRNEVNPRNRGRPINMILDVFWAAFPWRDCANQKCRDHERCHEGCLPPGKKLEMLRALAQVIVPGGARSKKTRGFRRDAFEKNRDEQDDRPCFMCGERFNHRHHMLQLQNGGNNWHRNIVLLCRACHALVHKGT